MKPQQRHIDAARKILSTLVPFSEWCPPWEKAVNELALALAEAENRAAWDGYDFGFGVAESVERCDDNSVLRLYREMAEVYGPRPTTENQA